MTYQVIKESIEVVKILSDALEDRDKTIDELSEQNFNLTKELETLREEIKRLNNHIDIWVPKDQF